MRSPELHPGSRAVGGIGAKQMQARSPHSTETLPTNGGTFRRSRARALTDGGAAEGAE